MFLNMHGATMEGTAEVVKLVDAQDLDSYG
jgi:hypothetical protein